MQAETCQGMSTVWVGAEVPLLLTTVKCDELSPCTACRRHGAQCSLLSQTDSSLGTLVASLEGCPVSAAPPKVPRKRGRPPGSKFYRPKFTDPSSRASAISSTHTSLTSSASESDWATDLELMHYYSTITYQTFPLPPRALQAFQIEIPRIARGHPYLLHQILAVSAYHMAYLHPESKARYCLVASHHQDRAVSGMRQGLANGITQESIFALFAASSLLMITTFASHIDRGVLVSSPDNSATIADLLDVLCLQRGVSVVQRTAQERLSSNPADQLLGQFIRSAEPDDYPEMEVIRENILELTEQLTIEDMDSKMNVVPVSGLTALMNAMDPNTGLNIIVGPVLRAVFRWPIYISDEFIKLLQEHDYGALTVTLFFCVLLKTVESDYWYFRGWASRVARAISSILSGTRWMKFARWPLEKIGESERAEECVG